MNIKDIEWRRTECLILDHVLFTYDCDLGRITVLDRMTGFSWGRDIETGYRNLIGGWYLNSGGYDIREFPELTIEEAIDKIKKDNYHD